MSANNEKKAPYINVAADFNILNYVFCCNSDNNKNNVADTPRNHDSKKEVKEIEIEDKIHINNNDK